jgi:large subunit ribosomal protein L25
MVSRFEPIGLKSGGTMDVILRTVKLSCLADDVPEAIVLDISNLEVGQSIHISELPKGKWEYKDNPENAIIVIHAKRGEATTESTEEAAEQAEV